MPITLFDLKIQETTSCQSWKTDVSGTDSICSGIICGCNKRPIWIYIFYFKKNPFTNHKTPVCLFAEISILYYLRCFHFALRWRSWIKKKSRVKLDPNNVQLSWNMPLLISLLCLCECASNIIKGNVPPVPSSEDQAGTLQRASLRYGK